MEIFIENWFLIVCAIAILALVVLAVIKFARSGSAAQMEKVREWLVYATSLAEKELGSGTGKLKLRQVYDQFLVRFPWLAQTVSFEKFSSLVDLALKETNSLLANNNAIREFVIGKDTTEEV